MVFKETTNKVNNEKSKIQINIIQPKDYGLTEKGMRIMLEKARQQIDKQKKY